VTVRRPSSAARGWRTQGDDIIKQSLPRGGLRGVRTGVLGGVRSRDANKVKIRAVGGHVVLGRAVRRCVDAVRVGNVHQEWHRPFVRLSTTVPAR